MATGANPPANNCRGQADNINDQPEQPPGLLSRPPRATRQLLDGGYDCEFVERPSSKLVQADCPVCLLVLREPHQVMCCGYSFCRSCIQTARATQKVCPACNEEFIIFPNKGLKRTLCDLRVYCSHRGLGCKWEGELGELDSHLNLQPPIEKLFGGCQLSETECTLCLQPFQRRYLRVHQSDDCPKRLFACQYCNQHEAAFEEVTQSHWSVCPSFPLSCPNNCNLVFQRQELEQHVRQDCPLTLVNCDFHITGCGVRLPRRDMAYHINGHITEHMCLLQAYTTTHPGEHVAVCMGLMVSIIQKVVIENALTHSQLQESKEELRKSHDQLCELQESHEQLQQIVTAQEAILTAHQQTLERVTYTGELPCDFTMTEFKCKTENDAYWCSSPFYTHTHGYKMCIKVYANGDGSGKGTKNLSVYAYLMQGPFDDELLWPFQGAITVQLLNQLEDQNHHTFTIHFTETTEPKYISRVKSGKQAGSGWGSHKVISHAKLVLDSKGNRQYLKDDQLKFRISKATILDLTSHVHRQCLKLESFTRAVEPQVSVVPIEFTLSEFEQQQNQDLPWISPAFYTHQQGYRMCLQVYPNGNFDGKGTHVSVYTCLMRGAFDDELKWPFRGDVTVQIVDQAGQKHHEKLVPYNSSTPDGVTNKVTAMERTDGRGFCKFLPHTSLGHNSATNSQYLQADCLRIRITKVEIKN